MLFASIDLVRRIERAERDLVTDATRALARTGAETLVLPVVGGAAAFSGADSPLTKVVGVGFDGAPDVEAIARVEAEFALRGAAIQVELSTLAESRWAETLTSRGYQLVGFENVLGRALSTTKRTEREAAAQHEAPSIEFPLSPASASAPSSARSSLGRTSGDADQPHTIDVATSPDAEIETWLDVVVESFAVADAQGVASHESFPHEAVRRIVRGMASTSGLVRYLARRDGIPAGGASLRIAHGVAQMCGAGTLDAHRRRGVQTTLTDRRLANAAAAGCDIAVLTTLPGSKSQENAQRRGFELLYARAILRRSTV